MTNHDATLQKIDAPFRNTGHALWSAFETVSKDVCKNSSAFRSGASGGEFNPFDRLTDGAIVVSVVHRLRDEFVAVVELHYNKALEPYNASVFLNFIGWRIAAQNGIYQRDLVVDCVRSWAGRETVRNDREWSAYYQIDERTVRKIRDGRRDRNRPGVYQHLDRLYGDAYVELKQAFWDRGLIEFYA